MKATSPSATKCAARARSSASIRSMSPAKDDMVAVVAPEAAQAALAAMRAHPLGRDAAIVGSVKADPAGLVLRENAVRRHPHRGYAGRGSAAPDLLTRHDRHRSSSERSSHQRLVERNRDLRANSSTRSPPSRAGLPRDVRSIPPRRPPARLRPRRLCHRRPACLGRVRASGDRRQACAAGARPFEQLRHSMLPSRSPTTSSWASARPQGDPEVAAVLDAARARGCHDVRAPRRPMRTTR